MEKKQEWSDWRQWDATTASHRPDEIQPGMTVEADIALIVHRTGNTVERHPWAQPFMPGFIFVAQDGSSWSMEAALMSGTPGIVAGRYRVWQGSGEAPVKEANRSSDPEVDQPVEQTAIKELVTQDG